MEEEFELNGVGNFISTPQEDSAALDFRSWDQAPASSHPLHTGAPPVPASDPSVPASDSLAPGRATPESGSDPPASSGAPPVTDSDPPVPDSDPLHPGSYPPLPHSDPLLPSSNPLLPASASLAPGRPTPVSGDDPSVPPSDPPVSGSPSATLGRPSPGDATAEFQSLHTVPSPSFPVQEGRGDQDTCPPAQQQRQGRPKGDHSGDSGVAESEGSAPAQESSPSPSPAQAGFLSVHDKEVERQRKEQLLEENLQLKIDRLCLICCIVDRDCILLPCGHVVCCNICAIRLLPKCPSCRTSIEEIVQIKLSPFVATRGQQRQQQGGEAAV